MPRRSTKTVGESIAPIHMMPINAMNSHVLERLRMRTYLMSVLE